MGLKTWARALGVTVLLFGALIAAGVSVRPPVAAANLTPSSSGIPYYGFENGTALSGGGRSNTLGRRVWQTFLV